MSEILICTMGYSPGVVTKMTQYLQQEIRPPRQLSQVWVVRTSDQGIGLLFNNIVVREFREGDIIQGLSPQEKVLSPSDTTTTQWVRTFGNEFSEFLESQVTADSPVVHLCLSGGRKSMTYAATMGFVKLIGSLRRSEIVQHKLVLWHIQLSSEEEASQRDYEDLRREYIGARNISGNEVNQSRRKALLYPTCPDQAQIVFMPFLYLMELPDPPADPWLGGLPEERI